MLERERNFREFLKKNTIFNEHPVYIYNIYISLSDLIGRNTTSTNYFVRPSVLKNLRSFDKFAERLSLLGALIYLKGMSLNSSSPTNMAEVLTMQVPISSKKT